MTLAYQGSKTATVSSSKPIQFSVGDWILVDQDSSRIWPVDEEAWPRETSVGVVKLMSEDLTIIEVGSEQRIEDALDS